MFTKATDLTKDEANALTELRAGIMWAQPFFSHLLLDQCTLTPTRDVPFAATDGKNIWLNPEQFAKWTLQQRLYVLCHEVCHVMWEHCQQGYIMRGGIFGPTGLLPVDHQLVNEVQDWTINSFLDECGIGEHPPEGHFNQRIKGGESWVGVYAEEYARRKQNQQNQQGGGQNGTGQQPPGQGQGGSGQQPPGTQPGNNPGGFDQHLPPGAGDGQTPQQAIAQAKEQQAEMRQAIAQAIAVAKARGTVPDAIKRLVSELIEPKVDWKDRMAALVVRNIGGGDHDWKSPDPIMLIFSDPVYTPRRAGRGVGTAVLVRDTSGSVGQREMNIMGGCMAGIFEQAMPERAFVIDCDAKVHQVIQLDNPTDIDAAEACKRAIGGGGTRFEPAFEKLDELGIVPDCLVYLTDGYGSFPKHPPAYPVIWAIIPGGKNSCPWGEVVKVEV